MSARRGMPAATVSHLRRVHGARRRAGVGSAVRVPCTRRAVILPAPDACRPIGEAVHWTMRRRDSSALQRPEPKRREPWRLPRVVLVAPRSCSRSSNLATRGPVPGAALRHSHAHSFAARRSLSPAPPRRGHPPCNPDTRMLSEFRSRADSGRRSGWPLRRVGIVWWLH
jgi:hypothetical protein